MPDDLKSTTKKGRRGIIPPDPRAEAKRKQIEFYARLDAWAEARERTHELDRLFPHLAHLGQKDESDSARDLRILRALPGPLTTPTPTKRTKRNYGTPEAALAAFYAEPGNLDLGQAAAFEKYRDEGWLPKQPRKMFTKIARRGPLPRR
jgi:hypothetical protein